MYSNSDSDANLINVYLALQSNATVGCDGGPAKFSQENNITRVRLPVCIMNASVIVNV